MISGSAVSPDRTMFMISSHRVACASSLTSAKLLFQTVDLLSFHALLLLKGSTTGIEDRRLPLKFFITNFVETFMTADTMLLRLELLSLIMLSLELRREALRLPPVASLIMTFFREEPLFGVEPAELTSKLSLSLAWWLLLMDDGFVIGVAAVGALFLERLGQAFKGTLSKLDDVAMLLFACCKEINKSAESVPKVARTGHRISDSGRGKKRGKHETVPTLDLCTGAVRHPAPQTFVSLMLKPDRRSLAESVNF